MASRVLVVGGPGHKKLDLIRALGGEVSDYLYEDKPVGLVIPWQIETKYYTAKIDFWVDQFQNTSKAIEQWTDDFTSDVASEVRQALGAVILVLDGLSKEKVSAWSRFAQKMLQEETRETQFFGVSYSDASNGAIGWCSDFLEDLGLELVHMNEVSGLARLREGLEVVPWNTSQVCSKAVGTEELSSEKMVEDLQELVDQIKAARQSNDRSVQVALADKLMKEFS